MRLAFTWHASRFKFFSLPRWLGLLCLGALSFAVYGFGLVAPYNLFALDLRPLRDVAKLTRGDPLEQASFVLAFAVLSALYYGMWRLCRGRQPAAMWRALTVCVIALNGLMLWLYPIGAADIFDNIARGRITAEHGGNPFYETPRAHKTDRFYGYLAWPDATSAYGPLWELLAAATSRVARDGVLANVLAFKLVGLAAYGGSVIVLAQILVRIAPARALQGVCLFALNPLVIYETAGNGHNDIVMVLFVVLAVCALTYRRHTWAALALTAGALVKFIPLLLVPLMLAAGTRALPHWRSRIVFLCGTMLACAALVAAAYAPFWRGGDPLDLGRRATLFTTSLPAVAQVYLEQWAGERPSQQIVSRLALLLTGAMTLFQAGRVWRQPTLNRFLRSSALLFTFYLLLTCLWFQPWYALWPLVFAALLPEGALARLIVLLSYSALWRTVFFDFVLYHGGPVPPRLWRETWLGPLTLGLPWLYALYLRLRRASSRALLSTLYSRRSLSKPSL